MMKISPVNFWKLNFELISDSTKNLLAHADGNVCEEGQQSALPAFDVRQGCEERLHFEDLDDDQRNDDDAEVGELKR